MKPLRIWKTFEFASRLPLDTFGFNRLCVYRVRLCGRNTSKRGLVSDAKDWYKVLQKCSRLIPRAFLGK